jgi:hypothetical protein
MKKILLLLMLSGSALYAGAQCEKSLNMTGPKMEIIGDAGQVINSREAAVLIELTKTTITLSFDNNPESVLSGPVKELKCNWKEPYKNGTMYIKAELSDQRGDMKHVVLHIEAKDGKIVLLGDAEERPNEQLKVSIDKIEEKS